LLKSFCNDGGTTITNINLGSATLNGTLSPLIGDFVDITEFNVEANRYLTGTVPATLSKWTKIEDFQIQTCKLTGVFPTMSFATMTNCQLRGGSEGFGWGAGNNFTCPYPAGVTTVQQGQQESRCKQGNKGDKSIIDSDCLPAPPAPAPVIPSSGSSSLSPGVWTMLVSVAAVVMR
jgi:hypothetical protein